MGLRINLVFDSNALAAPQSFRDGIQAAANILDAAIFNPITVNILVGYNEYDGKALPANTSLGGVLTSDSISYSSLRSLLANNETSAADVSAVNSLPNTSSLNGQSTFFLSTAEAKALGIDPPNNPAIDGATGFPSSFTGNTLIGAGIVELAHALGMLNGGFVQTLFHYTSPGVRVLTGNPPAAASYFSIDGGITDLANFNANFDTTLFASPGPGPYTPFSSLTPNDPFDVPISGSTTLTSVDLTMLDVLGFDVTPQASIPETSQSVSDFNGDGNSDILFRTANGSVPIWELNGSQITAAAFTTLGSSIVGRPALGWNIVDDTGDFNGDGKADILWQTTTSQVAIWEMNGTQIASAGFTTLGSSTVGAPAGWTILGAADFNGDGKSDILWQTGNGGAAIWEMNGAQIVAANYTLQGSTIVGAPGPDWHVIGSGDFNGDGDSDLLWRTDGGALAIWEMNGTQIKTADYIRQGAAQVKAPGPDWHIITTADFDGDGNSDLLWQTNAGQIAIWEMNGTQIEAAGFVPYQAPPGWRLEGAGDVNGDGKADLLWQTPAGQVAVWEMNGTQVIGSGYLTTNVTPASTPSDWTIAQHNYNFI
jgi:hypothetical protein